MSGGAEVGGGAGGSEDAAAVADEGAGAGEGAEAGAVGAAGALEAAGAGGGGPCFGGAAGSAATTRLAPSATNKHVSARFIVRTIANQLSRRGFLRRAPWSPAAALTPGHIAC